MSNKPIRPIAADRVQRRPKRNSFPIGKYTLLPFLILFALTNTNGQHIQQKKWVVGNTIIDFAPSIASPGTPPTVVKTFPSSTAFPVNSATDHKGNLLFYIRDYGIYDNQDRLVDTFQGPTNTNSIASEISIVPAIETPGCRKRYYIFYPYFSDANIYLRAKIVEVNASNASIVVTDHNSGQNIATENGYFTCPGNQVNLWEPNCGMAVSKLNNSKRYLYFVAGNSVQKITLFNIDSTNNGISDTSIIHHTNLPYLDWTDHRTWEADLSPDGSKLAWKCNSPKAGVGCHSAPSVGQLFIIGLDANGDYNGYTKAVETAGGSWHKAGGIEFTADGNKLWYTTPDRIAVLDLTTNPFGDVNVTGSFPYGGSMIERGPDSLMYAMKEDTLTAFDPVTRAMRFHITLNTYPITVNPLLNQPLLRTLPDQIDDEVEPEPYTIPFPFFDNPVNATTRTYQNYYETSGAHYWTPATFGGKDTIKLTGQHYFTGPNTSLAIAGLVVEFDDDAELYFDNGADLGLENCVLKGITGLNCRGGMWKGITTTAPPSISQVVVVHSTDSTPVIIQDAITGITAGGEQLNIIGDYMTFRANETGLALFTGASNGITTLYDGSVPLRNQSYGSNHGYSDGLNRTINNVLVWDGFLTSGTFIGGQYGIFARQPRTATSNTGLNAYFSGHKASGIYITQSEPGSIQRIDSSSFDNCYDGITFEGNKPGSAISITYNEFNSITRYGIDAFDNHGATIRIGTKVDTIAPEPTNDMWQNTFTNSGLAAIYLHNNAGYDDPNDLFTNIYIQNNNIASSALFNTTGIWITEPTAGTRKYNQLRVYNNELDNLCWGITTTNVVGGNDIKTKHSNLGFYPTNHINNNEIVVNNYQREYTGVSALATNGVSFVNNEIEASNAANRYNRSFSFKNSPNTLLAKNTTYTGWGMLAQGSMIGSNYYCNYIERAYEGMLMDEHILRGATIDSSKTKHGILDVEGRNNYFLNTPSGGKQLHLTNSYEASNLWVFTQSQAPQISYYNVVSVWTPDINSGSGPSICDSTGTMFDPPSNEIMQAPDSPTCIMTFYFDYYNYQQYLMGVQEEPTVSANIIALVEAESIAADGQHYQEALDLVNSIVPTAEPCLSRRRPIMADYKQLYQTYFAYKLADTIPRNMDSASIEIITAIASKNGITESPAAFSARAILWDEKQIRIDGEEFAPELVVAGQLDAGDCDPQPVQGNAVYLVDNDGQIVEGPVYTDANGQFAFDEGITTAYENDANQYSIRTILSNGSIVQTNAATVQELAQNSDHILECSTSIGPFNILGLVHAVGCPDMNPSGIMVYLMKENNEIVEGPVMVSFSGTFGFNPVLVAPHYNSGLYKIRLVFTDATVAETPAATIMDLATGSVHEFNCPDEDPIILPKKSDTDKGPLNYKEWTSKQETETAFNVSPNPSSGVFRITGAGSQAIATLKNLVGQVVVNDLPLTNGILDVSNLKAGVYILTVTGKHETYVRKITIRK